jgi:hypothetical protein
MKKDKIQKTKLFLRACVGFISILTTQSTTQLIAPKQISNAPANASTPPGNAFKYQGILQENMGLLLGIDEKKIKMTSLRRATWQDCLKSPMYVPNCQPISLSGWRVTMSGQDENWVYYVTDNGNVTLDHRASLNKAIRSTLAKELALQPNQLQITAANLMRTSTPCPKNTTNCKTKQTVEWRILTNRHEQPFHLKLNGKPSTLFNFGQGFIPQDTAKMPREVASKVLNDVVNRDGVMTANFRVESIKATTWNWCRGGSGAGPTPPDMGACPDVNQQGWQMIVVSGANRYFYYIPQDAIANISLYQVKPDGMQSLPKLAMEKVQKDAAKRASLSTNSIPVRFAEARFFDGCLNIEKQKLSCGNSIQGGWQVTAIGGKPSANLPPMSSATWIYHVNLTGNNARFIQSSSWMPKP